MNKTSAAATTASAFVAAHGASAVRFTPTTRRDLISFTMDADAFVDMIPAIRAASGFRFIVTNCDITAGTYTVEV